MATREKDPVKRQLAAVLAQTSDTTGIPEEWVYATDAQKEKAMNVRVSLSLTVRLPPTPPHLNQI
jgi:hypothetical protein